MRALQRFEVSLKAFVVRDDARALMVREADTGFWELPGGRIDVGEEWTAHADVLRREIAEELGDAFKVEIGAATVSWTRQRTTDGVFQFVLARICRRPQGTLHLSPEHSEARWITREDLAALQLPPHSGYHDGLIRLFAVGVDR